MIELLVTYKPEIVACIKFFTLPFFVFLISMAHVYVWGRMLNIVNHYRVKNFIALITIIGSYALFFFTVEAHKSFSEVIWYLVVYGSITILMYVILGFKLYDRIDTKLDSLFKAKRKK